MNISVFIGSDGRKELCEQAEYIGEQVASAKHTIVFYGKKTGMAKHFLGGAIKKEGRIIYKDDINEFKDAGDAFLFIPGGLDVLAALCQALWEHKHKILEKPIAVYSMGNCMSNFKMQLMLLERLGISCEVDYIYSWNFEELLHKLEKSVHIEEIEFDDDSMDVDAEVGLLLELISHTETSSDNVNSTSSTTATT